MLRHLPVLATERLLLRVPTERDAGVMARFALENREHFEPWDPERDDNYFTVPHWRRLLGKNLEYVRKGTQIQFMIVEQNADHHSVVGQCMLSGITRGVFQAAYLGYGLDHRYVGRGYMTEALQAVIEYAFDELNLHRIMAGYMPENARSGRVLERLGFEREGLARDYLYLAGEWRDHILTALINRNWKPTPGP